MVPLLHSQGCHSSPATHSPSADRPHLQRSWQTRSFGSCLGASVGHSNLLNILLSHTVPDDARCIPLPKFLKISVPLLHTTQMLRPFLEQLRSSRATAII